MNIDKPMMEPKPDPPLGIPCEVLGDPSGGDGGGGGRRKLRDGSKRGSRRMLEIEGSEMDGSRSRRGSRRMSEIEGLEVDGSRRMLEIEGSRSHEGQKSQPVIPDLPCDVSGKTQGDPRGGGGSSRGRVALRRIRDSHWRRTGQWLDDDITMDKNEEVHGSLGSLRVPEPNGKGIIGFRIVIQYMVVVCENDTFR